MNTELHKLYAAAIHEDAQRPSGERVGIINAVLAVRDLHIEQLTVRLGQYADRAIKNGERADELATALGEALDCIVNSDGQPHPRDFIRWRTVLDKTNTTRETTP